MLDKALALAAYGYPVFPLSPGCKVPVAGTRGALDATTDPEAIRFLWEMFPDSNVGIHPGAAGLVVFDIDVKRGAPGPLSWEMTAAIHGAPDTEAVVTTPTGGLHLYYRGHCAPSAGKLGPGLDVRSHNSYVVAPGSVVDGIEYAGELPPIFDLPDAPETLIAACGAPSKAAERRDRDEAPEGADLEVAYQRAAEWLQGTAKPAIEGSGGNSTTYQVVCTVRDLGIPEDFVVGLLLDHYNARCVPPWSEAELDRITRNAYRYAQEDIGRDAPPTPEAAFGPAPPPMPPEGNRFLDALVSGDAVDKLPNVEWVAKGWMTKASLNLVIGQYGSGKSFASINACLDFAHGADRVLGCRCAGDNRRVLYVAAEGAAGLAPRIEAWRRDRGINATPEGFHILSDVPDFSASSLDWEIFMAAVKWIDPAIVVIDTASRAMTGMDENSAADMTTFAHSRCGDLQRTGAAVLVLHHPPKSGAEKGGPRGSSVLPAAADSVIEIDKGASAITAKMVKLKDGPLWDRRRGYKFAQIILRQDEDGDDVTSLTLSETTDLPAEQAATKADPTLQAIRDADEASKVATACARANQMAQAIVPLALPELASHFVALYHDGDAAKTEEVRGYLSRIMRKIRPNSVLDIDMSAGYTRLISTRIPPPDEKLIL